jgi:ferredoxin
VPYRITDACIACGACSVVCPLDAIENGYNQNLVQDVAATVNGVRERAMEQGLADKASRFYRINKKCNDCGACLELCPTQAIK